MECAHGVWDHATFFNEIRVISYFLSCKLFMIIKIFIMLTSDFPIAELFFPSFTNVVDSAREEAARLKDEGVEMLIALGHYGYAEDMAMAEQESIQ